MVHLSNAPLSRKKKRRNYLLEGGLWDRGIVVLQSIVHINLKVQTPHLPHCVDILKQDFLPMVFLPTYVEKKKKKGNRHATILVCS